MATDDRGAWHVSACLRGTGRRVYRDERDFLFSVQRYVTPQEGRRYTGDVVCRTFDTEAEAQAVATALNDRGGACGTDPWPIRGAYL